MAKFAWNSGSVPVVLWDSDGNPKLEITGAGLHKTGLLSQGDERK